MDRDAERKSGRLRALQRAAGTLGFSWKIAPTSVNTANAIVKRDASGNFSAGEITAVAINADATGSFFGVGVAGTASAYGVRGEATPSGGTGVFGFGGTNGVVGHASSGLRRFRSG